MKIPRTVPRIQHIHCHKSKRLEPMPYEEIGRRFGVTRERIRQIEAAALRKLRGRLTLEFKLSGILGPHDEAQEDFLHAIFCDQPDQFMTAQEEQDFDAARQAAQAEDAQFKMHLKRRTRFCK